MEVTIDLINNRATMPLDEFRRMQAQMEDLKTKVSALQGLDFKPLPPLSWKGDGCVPDDFFIRPRAVATAGRLAASHVHTFDYAAISRDIRVRACQDKVRDVLIEGLKGLIAYRHEVIGDTVASRAEIIVGKVGT